MNTNIVSNSLTIHGLTVDKYNKIYLHNNLGEKWDVGFKGKKSLLSRSPIGLSGNARFWIRSQKGICIEG